MMIKGDDSTTVNAVLSELAAEQAKIDANKATIAATNTLQL